MPVIENTIPRNQLPNSVLFLIGLTLATSSIVFFEPAPYDLLVIVMLIVLVLRGLKFPRELQLAGLCLGIFALANTLAAVGSADPLSTIPYLGTRIYMLLAWCLFACLIVASPAKVLRVIWIGYALAAILAVSWGSLEYFGFIRMEMWEGGLRAKGPFKDPNVFAPFLIPAAIYGLRELYSKHSPFYRAVNLLVFIFITFGILIAFSRGGWLAFVTSFGLFSIMYLASLESFRARLKMILSNMLLVLAAVSVLAVAIVTTSASDRFSQRAVVSQEYDFKEGGRFYTQQLALKRIGVTPLGIGPGRSPKELGIAPHNVYLLMFIETGWIGGLTFTLFLFLTFYRSLALFRWNSPLRGDFFIVFVSLAGLLFQSFFIDSIHWRHFWLLLAMNWGLIISYERSRSIV
jgi:O-antigen ligase